MPSKKSFCLLVYLLASSCAWGMFVLSLILVSKQVLDDYHSTADYTSAITKGVITFLLLPQYIMSFAYLFAIMAFSIDALSKEKRRVHFLTTLYTSSVSMVFLLTAGVSVFINGSMIVIAKVYHHHSLHEESLVGSGDNEVLNKDSVLAGVMGQIVTNVFWAKTLLISAAVMLGLYSFYYCYWPHSLRYRRRIDKRLLSNINDVEDEDDDEL